MRGNPSGPGALSAPDPKTASFISNSIKGFERATCSS
jgi:hypothetical protein